MVRCNPPAIGVAESLYEFFLEQIVTSIFSEDPQGVSLLWVPNIIGTNVTILSKCTAHAM